VEVAALSQETELAKAVLAQRLGTISPSAVTFQFAESVDWPDTSLGCPLPEMMYAQVVTPGYRIILTYEGKEYGFHGSPAGAAFPVRAGGPHRAPRVPESRSRLAGSDGHTNRLPDGRAFSTGCADARCHDHAHSYPDATS
jgi:hypothetical protein